jgi:hypothetical protein
LNRRARSDDVRLSAGRLARAHNHSLFDFGSHRHERLLDVGVVSLARSLVGRARAAREICAGARPTITITITITTRCSGAGLRCVADAPHPHRHSPLFSVVRRHSSNAGARQGRPKTSESSVVRFRCPASSSPVALRHRVGLRDHRRADRQGSALALWFGPWGSFALRPSATHTVKNCQPRLPCTFDRPTQTTKTSHTRRCSARESKPTRCCVPVQTPTLLTRTTRDAATLSLSCLWWQWQVRVSHAMLIAPKTIFFLFRDGPPTPRELRES